jgi:hypothetical protein
MMLKMNEECLRCEVRGGESREAPIPDRNRLLALLALALDPQLVDARSGGDRVGMGVLDQCQQPGDLALDLGGCRLQLVARAPVLLGETLALGLIGRDGASHDFGREQMIAERQQHALLHLARRSHDWCGPST